MVLIRDMTPRVTFPPPLGPACSLAARCRARSLQRIFHVWGLVTCFCCGEGCLLAWGPSLGCTAPPSPLPVDVDGVLRPPLGPCVLPSE